MLIIEGPATVARKIIPQLRKCAAETICFYGTMPSGHINDCVQHITPEPIIQYKLHLLPAAQPGTTYGQLLVIESKLKEVDAVVVVCYHSDFYRVKLTMPKEEQDNIYYSKIVKGSHHLHPTFDFSLDLDQEFNLDALCGVWYSAWLAKYSQRKVKQQRALRKGVI